MNFEHLKVFVNLAETLNFSRTAIEMNLSQSAVSQIISSMENELNFFLFKRTRKEVHLTESGREFYHSIKPLLNVYDKSVQKAKSAAIRKRNNLTIGYSGTPYEISILPKLIEEYNRNIGNDSLYIFLENFAHNELKDRLLNGDCDIIFTMPDIISKMENVKYINLVEGHYCVNFYNSSGIKHNIFKISELNKFRLVFSDSEWCPPSQNILQKYIVSVNKDVNVAYANNILSSSLMVKAGLGVGIWADFVNAYQDKTITSVPLNYSIRPKYGIAMLDYGVTTSTKRFANWLSKNYLKFK
ncbi:Transcriptional regulator (LysR family) [Lactobacillus kullabergensis]|uniref:Transcriptional regulator (LysR family) n=2 Tax=Lactobacillus kullabergensis TaxID=1218493 RepID=A0A0F4L9E4_9LACO|nr:LysR family transcriptional regulator [Lactobacillus kullabergensis]KJY55432.1 Transcriptional regulator (LysR family) [Lactobacillus kullabergensis]MBC6369494.1 LysR family transcriptional regulator [Lactobacillus kullabergensis]